MRGNLNLFLWKFFLKIRKKNTVAGSIYRVPDSNIDDFIKEYSSIIAKINNEGNDLNIGTDQNLDYLKINTHKKTAKFFDINLESGILPCFTKPTRVTSKSATLIDNIYISDCRQKYQPVILTCDISDHFPCLLMLEKNLFDIDNSTLVRTRKVTYGARKHTFPHLDPIQNQ